MATTSLLLLTLTLTLLFLSLPRASSRTVGRPSLRVALHRVDSTANYTNLERLQRAVARGRGRVERLNNKITSLSSSGHEAPVTVGEGEFMMELAIGTPERRYMAVMDTGSDLVWTQCKPCRQCFKQSTPVFDPKKSSTFKKMSCSSGLCKALPQPQPKCHRRVCMYSYMYGDFSTTEGIMATETFSFDTTKVKKIGFGCGLENLGDGFSNGAGIVGLGRGPLSLISQLKEPKFSYCLTSLSDTTTTSTLLMGQLASPRPNSTARPGPTQTTRLLTNKLQPSLYYLPLQGISVGPTRLPIENSAFSLRQDGTGGLCIDSGTTITYLEHSLFDLVRNEFVSQVNLSVVENSEETIGLELCFDLPPGESSMEVPELVFHFEGADLDFPAENYLIPVEGVVCLAMGGSSGVSILGNIQQQNMLVVHDLKKKTVSFSRTKCDEI